MQSLKTAFVVVLLGAMLYGVYVVVNTPPARTPRAVQEHLAESDAMLEVEEGGEDDAQSDTQAPEPRRSSDRRVASSSAKTRRPARMLETSEDTDPKSPAVEEYEPTANDRSADAADSNKEPGAERSSTKRDSLANFAEGRSPVGLERDDSTPPPTPPRDGVGPLAAVPVPDLTGTEPVGDAASPAADSGRNDVANADSAPTEQGGAIPPPPLAPSSPVGGAAPAAGGFVSTESPTPAGNGGSRFVPGGSVPDGTAPSETVPSPPGGEAAPTANPSTSIEAPKSAREGVRFDPKEAVFDRSWKEAQQELQMERPRQALLVLSQLYADPRLNAQERKVLHDALDPLAARVIYSTEHLLDQPYEVHKGDTLPAIAERYRVPWQLLANINGVKDPTFLLPGTKLKVLRGPFKAEVDLASQELVLYWNQLYAGRFPISTGNEPTPTPGEYEVKSKLPGRDYPAANGQVLPAGDASNPYGNVFLDLGRGLAIHGSPIQEGAPAVGCVSLSPRDAEDVYGILTVGSTVTIRR